MIIIQSKLSILISILILENANYINCQFVRPNGNKQLQRLQERVDDIETDINQLNKELYKTSKDSTNLKNRFSSLQKKIDTLNKDFDTNIDKKQEIFSSIINFMNILNSKYKALENVFSKKINKLVEKEKTLQVYESNEFVSALSHNSYDLAAAKVALIKEDDIVKDTIIDSYKKLNNIDKLIDFGSYVTNVTRKIFIYRTIFNLLSEKKEKDPCDYLKLIDKVKSVLINIDSTELFKHEVDQFLNEIKTELALEMRSSIRNEFRDAVDVKTEDYSTFNVVKTDGTVFGKYVVTVTDDMTNEIKICDYKFSKV